MGVQNYQDWIRLVAELTVNSLNAWHWSGSSVYYLLGLWSRLVSSMPYLKGDSPSLLDTFVPKISRAYINSRSVHAKTAPLIESGGGSGQTARLSSDGPFTRGATPFPLAPHAANCSLPVCWPSASLQKRSTLNRPAGNLHHASVRKL